MPKCPQCSHELVIKHKGHNSFYACSAFPQCDFTQGLREQSEIEPESLGVECPECGRDLQLKSGRFGLFVGCSGFPDCDFVTEPNVADEHQGVSCPECQKSGRSGQLIQKTSRRGSSFFACTEYPQCDYSVNFPPLAKACPECRFPILLRKKQGGITRHFCPQKNCEYKSEPL